MASDRSIKRPLAAVVKRGTVGVGRRAIKMANERELEARRVGTATIALRIIGEQLLKTLVGLFLYFLLIVDFFLTLMIKWFQLATRANARRTRQGRSSRKTPRVLQMQASPSSSSLQEAQATMPDQSEKVSTVLH